MEYIRKTYGVQAKRVARIHFFDGQGHWYGRITSAKGALLRVLVDDRIPGYRGRLLIHPTWNVEYL